MSKTVSHTKMAYLNLGKKLNKLKKVGKYIQNQLYIYPKQSK